MRVVHLTNLASCDIFIFFHAIVLLRLTHLTSANILWRRAAMPHRIALR